MKSSPAFRPGTVVAWWDGHALAFGVVAAEEKQRLHLVLERGRQERVKPSRIAAEVESPGAVPGTSHEERAEAAERVARVAERVRGLAVGVDVGLIWEIIHEGAGEGSASAVDPAELAELALERSTGEARAATLLALIDDGVHFVRRGVRWEARSRQAVEGLHQQRRRVSEREEETRAFLERVRAAVRGEAYLALDTPTESRYLDALERLAIHEEGAPEASRSIAMEALAASGLRYDRPHEGAFHVLRKLGRFSSDDENLQLRRYHLRTEFPPEVLDHAREASQRGGVGEGRTDLRHLQVVTIDGARTREIDDALSLEPLDGGRRRLGVHIADPAALVAPDDPVDREALSRAVTHYLPDLTLTMLPPAIAEQAASLVEGEDRPALSFLVEIDEQGEISDYELARSVIRCRTRLDYARADRIIAGDEDGLGPLLRNLTAVAALRRGARARSGAILIDAPEVDVHVDADGRVTLERLDAGSASRSCVTEAMVVAGEVAARFCVAEAVPAIYRRQTVSVDLPPVPDEGVRDPVAVRAVRQCLKRAEVGLRPGPHSSLGLSAYAQVTSPLRRYQDLATHRQIAARLRGEATLPHDEPAMQRIAATTDRVEADARRAERAAEDYWLLKYLERQTGGETDGTVVEVRPRPVVQLAETLRETPMPSLAGVDLGTVVRLRIERVNPRAGLLALRRLD